MMEEKLQVSPEVRNVHAECVTKISVLVESGVLDLDSKLEVDQLKSSSPR